LEKAKVEGKTGNIRLPTSEKSKTEVLKEAGLTTSSKSGQGYTWSGYCEEIGITEELFSELWVAREVLAKEAENKGRSL